MADRVNDLRAYIDIWPHHINPFENRNAHFKFSINFWFWQKVYLGFLHFAIHIACSVTTWSYVFRHTCSVISGPTLPIFIHFRTVCNRIWIYTMTWVYANVHIWVYACSCKHTWICSISPTMPHERAMLITNDFIPYMYVYNKKDKTYSTKA